MADGVAPLLPLQRPPPFPVHYDALDFVERAKLRCVCEGGVGGVVCMWWV